MWLDVGFGIVLLAWLVSAFGVGVMIVYFVLRAASSEFREFVRERIGKR